LAGPGPGGGSSGTGGRFGSIGGGSGAGLGGSTGPGGRIGSGGLIGPGRGGSGMVMASFPSRRTCSSSRRASRRILPLLPG